MQTKPKSGAKSKVLLAALLLGAMASEAAFAQHRHHHRIGPRIGFYVGAPLLAYSLYRPYYRPYYYSPYYYPPVAVVPPSPPVYVEQPQVLQPQVVQPPVQLDQQFQPAPQMYQQYQQQPAETAPQTSGSMWYYCAESRAYYPYVKQCPAGWQQVTPQPQG